MKFFVSGATGFIGRDLVKLLVAEGHEVVAWSRSVERAAKVLGPPVRVVGLDDEHAARLELSTCDGIANLAGEPIIGQRWSLERKRALRDSRVGLTQTLARLALGADPTPKVFVSASAVGYYGDRGDERLTEASSRGTGFLSDLCDDWEGAARVAEGKMRVVLVRTGIVLGRDGGALSAMLPAFRLGLGGRIGDGCQFVPWVHKSDIVHLFRTALLDERYRGPVNGTAKNPVRNREFAHTLGQVLHRPAMLPAPAFALKLALGQAAETVLGGQNAVPELLSESAFPYRYDDLKGALTAAVNG